MTDFLQAHTPTPGGMVFYNSFNAVKKDDDKLWGYVSVIKRAFEELKLNGVLCLDGRPVLYLRESSGPFSEYEKLRLQKLFWNQGVANVLVLADPIAVYIYSGLAEPAKNQQDSEDLEKILIDRLQIVDYVQRIQSMYLSLATGHYYEQHEKHFNPKESVDSRLLDNLRDLRDILTKGDECLETSDVHALIGRLLFLCYLLDRGIYPIGTPAKDRTGTMLLSDTLESFPSPEGQINYLYGLFADLKEKFNGNMFDQDLEAEKCKIKPSHMEKLVHFIGGHDVQSRQTTLSFWPYDFKMIPVETISAIYQDFLTAEDPDSQREKGAFYTPRFLAEMVVDLAIHDEPDAENWSFLDPACGSGIFLVILFNRLASRWIHRQKLIPGYAAQAEALKKILDRQIRGMDINETACRIACFSLYLAYLDFFSPPDIQQHIEKTGQPLPKLLDYGDDHNRPKADIPVVHRRDFIAEGVPSAQAFDCIIGNPPWQGRGTKQLAQRFMEKAPESLRTKGIGCLLLPAKMLQNQTDAFQARWLRQITLEKVLQLADYRHLLFQNAKTPAFIARFKKEVPQTAQHRIEFIAPKFNRDGLRQGVITVNPASRTWIPLAEILAATQTKIAPVVWKRRLWGTARDQKLLDILQTLPPLSELAGAPGDGKRWIKGQGFQPYFPEKAKNNPNYPKPKPNPWNLKTPFAHTDQSLELIVFKHDFTTLGERLDEIEASKEYLRRRPNEKVFKSPMVLISHGFSKVAYCDYDIDVLFQSTLESITCPQEDLELLMFLAIYLRSNLSQYFLFHTAANWGSERNKVHLEELLRIPFPLPGNENIPPESEQIIKEVAKRFCAFRDELSSELYGLKVDAKDQSLFRDDSKDADIRKKWQLERKKRVDRFQKELEPLIYRYFGLTDQEMAIIEDTISIFEPSSTPTTWHSPKTVTLDQLEETKVRPYDTRGIQAYADTLTATLNKWAHAEGSSSRVRAEGMTDSDTGLAMIKLILTQAESAYREIALSRPMAIVLKDLFDASSRKDRTLLNVRDIFLFHGKKIFIVRADILLNWTRTAALNDAARIFGDIALMQQRSLNNGQ
ncbi:MAG: N-6 DNA methylase [Syntrophales bacterium]